MQQCSATIPSYLHSSYSHQVSILICALCPIPCSFLGHRRPLVAVTINSKHTSPPWTVCYYFFRRLFLSPYQFLKLNFNYLALSSLLKQWSKSPQLLLSYLLILSGFTVNSPLLIIIKSKAAISFGDFYLPKPKVPSSTVQGLTTVCDGTISVASLQIPKKSLV